MPARPSQGAHHCLNAYEPHQTRRPWHRCSPSVHRVPRTSTPQGARCVQGGIRVKTRDSPPGPPDIVRATRRPNSERLLFHQRRRKLTASRALQYGTLFVGIASSFGRFRCRLPSISNLQLDDGPLFQSVTEQNEPNMNGGVPFMSGIRYRLHRPSISNSVGVHSPPAREHDMSMRSRIAVGHLTDCPSRRASISSCSERRQLNANVEQFRSSQSIRLLQTC